MKTEIVICPKYHKCVRNDDGIGKHCGQHKRDDDCGYSADGCPKCVLVNKMNYKIEDSKEVK